jgi:hypothetical protein
LINFNVCSVVEAVLSKTLVLLWLCPWILSSHLLCCNKKERDKPSQVSVTSLLVDESLLIKMPNQYRCKIKAIMKRVNKAWKLGDISLHTSYQYIYTVSFRASKLQDSWHQLFNQGVYNTT